AENRHQVAAILADSGCFPGQEEALQRSLVGPLNLGTGQSIDAARFHIFHRNNANEPTSERGRWLADEFVAHGLIPASRRSEAATELRACWTSSVLPAPAPSPP